jgi:hypothetical protein
MIAGKWTITINTPAGVQTGTLDLAVDGANLTGWVWDERHRVPLSDGTIDGNQLAWSMKVAAKVKFTLKCKATVEGDRITGTAKHMLGSIAFSGVRE